MPAPPRKKMLSIQDAALATGLSPKALRRRIERETLASEYANGRRWISMDELLRQGLLVGLDGASANNGRRRATGPTLADRLVELEAKVAGQDATIADLQSRLAAFEARFGKPSSR